VIASDFKKLTGARLLDLTDNVSHTSLVADESSQVGLLASIVLRELSDWKNNNI
jgi:hypothetical protein